MLCYAVLCHPRWRGVSFFVFSCLLFAMKPNFEPFWYFISRWFLFHFSCFTCFLHNPIHRFHKGFPIHCIFTILNFSILTSECSGAHPPLWMLESSCPAHSLIIGYGPQKKNASMVPCWQHRTFSNAGARAKPKKPKKQKKQYFRNPGPRASEPRVPEILFFFCFLGLAFTPALEHARCFPRPICITLFGCVTRCWHMCRTGHVDNDHNARRYCMKNGCFAEAKCYML